MIHTCNRKVGACTSQVKSGDLLLCRRDSACSWQIKYGSTHHVRSAGMACKRDLGYCANQTFGPPGPIMCRRKDPQSCFWQVDPKELKKLVTIRVTPEQLCIIHEILNNYKEV